MNKKWGYPQEVPKNMKDRIHKLMLSCGMTQQNFASELCLAPATLSSIYNGRTRPTNAIVNAIHERFPDISITWLMFGEGDMYVTGKSAATDTQPNQTDSPASTGDPNSPGNTAGDGSFPTSLFDPSLIGSSGSTTKSNGSVTSLQTAAQHPEVKIIEKIIDKPQRKIKEIRVFFDDGTYETFSK